MANQDVRDAADTLDTAIQALDASALLSADFTPGAYESYASGQRFYLAREVERLKDISTELVTQLEAIRELED